MRGKSSNYPGLDSMKSGRPPGDYGVLVLPSADEKTASENLSDRWQAGGRTRTGISASHLVTDHGLPLTMLVEETWMGQ